MKKAENNITELVFILDRSGSMSGLVGDTIGGFNSLIKSRKSSRANALFQQFCLITKARFYTTGLSFHRCAK